MGKRRGKYARIWQAARLAQARARLIEYESDPTKRPVPTGTPENRPPSIKLVITRPFGPKLATGQWVAASALQPAWTANQAHMGARVTTQGSGEDSGKRIAIAGYSAARAIFTTGKSATGDRKPSKRTGLSYIDYGGNSLSLPFGGKDATETELEAFGEIEGAFGDATGTAISWQREVA